MSDPVIIGSLDLAALLCSRVCHDLISPVGAINNGLEVMEDDSDAETKAFAMELIHKSARTASAKLQFCRLAFGAAGSPTAEIDTGDAEKVARGMVEDDKTKLTWNLPRAFMAKNRVKLVLNLLLIAVQSIPRGGTITVDPAGESLFHITTSGPNARVPPAAPALLAGQPHDGAAIDAHGIQPFYAGMLARECGLAVNLALEGEGIVIATNPVQASAPAAA